MTEDEIQQHVDTATGHAKKITTTYATWLKNQQAGKYPNGSEFGGLFNELDAITTGIASSKPTPVTYKFGFSSHIGDYSDPDAYVAKLAATGAKLLRDDISWSDVERVKGTFDFSKLDLLASLARKYAMKIMPVAGFTPGWANGGRDNKTGPYNVADFGNYGGKLAAYAYSHHSDVLYGIETYNEPNSFFLVNPTNGVAGDPGYFVQLNNAFYTAAKALAPRVIIISGATAGTGTYVWNEHTAGWTEQVFPTAKFDEWSCHPYVYGADWTGEQMTDLSQPSPFARTFWSTQVETLEQQLTRWGHSTCKIHFTEFGCPTNRPDGAKTPRGTDEFNQAREFELAYPLFRTKSRAGWYCHYTGEDIDTNDLTDEQKHFGALHSDRTNKLIVAKMQAIH